MTRDSCYRIAPDIPSTRSSCVCESNVLHRLRVYKRTHSAKFIPPTTTSIGNVRRKSSASTSVPF